MKRTKQFVNPNRAEKDFVTNAFAASLIERKRKELCATCAVSDCLLIPITTKGDDCPYYSPAQKEQL